jgi:uncharacterized Fe-S cluster-containing radical SAM superfamily protein
MMRVVDGKREYLVAELEGSGQVGEIYDKHFRPKDYIKERAGLSQSMKDWLTAPNKEIWSSTFLGLDEAGIQKLEFQNPAYVAAYKLGGDPRDYNRVFTVQLVGCTYECAFCYVPNKLNNLQTVKGHFFSAEQIIGQYEKSRNLSLERDSKDIKVIRLTGGEVPSIVPELIIDIWKELERKGLEKTVYLWIDSNLSTSKYMRAAKDLLSPIFKQKNVGIVGCIKTIGDGIVGSEDFSTITKAPSKDYETQFDTMTFLINEMESDFYVYLIPIMRGTQEQIQKRLELFASKLYQINKNLPLRVNILHIHFDYSPVEANMQKAELEDRQLPSIDEKKVLSIWYNEVLPKFYKPDDLMLFRCQIPLKDDFHYTKTTGNKSLIFFKSAARDEYRGKILTSLSLPKNLFLNTWFDKKWVSDDVWALGEKDSEALKKYESLIIFVDQTKTPFVFYPLRKCTFYASEINGLRLFLWLKMGDYCKYTGEQLDRFNRALRATVNSLPPNIKSYTQLLDISQACAQIETSSDLTTLENLIKIISNRTGDNFKDAIFYWFDIRDAKNKKMPKIKEIDSMPYLLLKEEKRYKISFNYFTENSKQLLEQGLQTVKISFTLDSEHFSPSDKSIEIPSSSRISIENVIFKCTKSGDAELKISRPDNLQNAPNPLVKVRVGRGSRSFISGGFVFLGLVIMAIPQIFTFPLEYTLLSQIVSLVIGPSISAVAVWLGNK